MKKNIFAFVAVLVAVIPLTTFAQANFTTAESFLNNHANDPWSTMGLVALNSNSIPTDYLKSISGSSAIEYAAPILAIGALGENPRTFGATNYVDAMKAYDSNNQIGDVTSVNDDVFGLLALLAAGEDTTDNVVLDAKNFILANQQSNGGWGFATAGGTDSNMTAAAV